MAVWLSTFKLDCRKCSNEVKIEKGCEKDSPIPGVWQLYNWRFQRCPIKLITVQSVRYLQAYKFFKKGHLPNPGGWMEQSIKFIQAIEVIEREIAAIEKEEIKTLRKKNAYQ